MTSFFGLRVVAIFEAGKGLLVLIAALGLFKLMYGVADVDIVAEKIVRQLHLNPAGRYPRAFIDATSRLSGAQLRLLAAATVVYAAVRFVEAYGLWRARLWAEWFGAVSGGIYIPAEIYELWERFTWLKVTVFLANCAIVGYLVWALWRARVSPAGAVRGPRAPA